MTDEPLLDEIRRVRHQISASIGHDPRRIVAYYAELQRQHQGRVIDLSGEGDSGHVVLPPKASLDLVSEATP